MKFLIFGAGVIGSIFAGKLAQAGYDVTVLARGNRLAELRNNGVVLQHAHSNKTEISPVKLIEELKPDDSYDYILVVMQKTQVEDVLKILAQNQSPNIVFVVNNALGYDKWASIIGKERLMIGFPSAGGQRANGIVNYFIGKGLIRSFQTTTFGEYDGSKTLRLKTLVKAFSKAGIPSVSSANMDAWQKSHVAIVTSIANILYKYNGNNYELSKSMADIKLMIKGIKEGLLVLKALGCPVTPLKLNYFWLPTSFLVFVFKPVMGTKLAELTMSKHAMAAIEEMKCLQQEFDILIDTSQVKTPAIDQLKQFLDSRIKSQGSLFNH